MPSTTPRHVEVPEVLRGIVDGGGRVVEAYCSSSSGTVATACPPDITGSGDFVARCRQGEGTTTDYELYMYEDYTGALNTQSGCETYDGTFSDTWE